MAQDTDAPLLKQALPLTRQLAFGAQIRAIQTAVWLASFTSSPDKAHAPNLVKTYSVRPKLPVRVFIPSSYTAGSSQPLPTLFSIHGGGFCIGSPQDDDAWNRAFADKHSILVIALNYSKAPSSPFPNGLEDLVSLYLAALGDSTLPIDKADGGRIAICGFSAGGNFTLSLSQRLMKSENCPCRPRAAISVYGALDLSRPREEKILTRQYKTDAGLGSPRGSDRDFLLPMAPLFDWSYLPVGQDIRDPLVSPGPYAAVDDLPPNVFIIASELDMLANDSRECAYRLAQAWGSSRRIDPADQRCGRPEVGKPGELELDDERFAWEEKSAKGSLRWLLVPDVLHGFDNLPMRKRLSNEETAKDAELKTEAYCNILGEWLHGTVF